MKNALILHGTNANHTENWFPWLEKELKKKGYRVWTPDLPRAEKPNLRRYNDFLFPKWHFDKNSIIVGHSSGAVAILGILQELPDNAVINRAILVAGFLDDLGWESLKELFLIRFNWKKIKKHANKIIFIHSDNDPYVSVIYGKKLKQLLGGELIILHNKGHFSSEDSPQFKKFPKLLEFLK